MQIDANLMQSLIWAAMGCGFTWLMTTAGSAVVFFFRKDRAVTHRIFLGFAAGVMIAASVWSLLNPAIEQAEELGQVGWIPAAGGFLLGWRFLWRLTLSCPIFIWRVIAPRASRRAGNAPRCSCRL